MVSIRNVWVSNVTGQAMTRLTFGDSDVFSLFAPDGRRVVYTSGHSGPYNIFWTAADGSGSPERLTEGTHAQKATSWSPNGEVMLFNDVGSGSYDVLQLELNRGRTVRPFLNTPFNELEAVFSPDGRWVAYESDESGRWEIYVRPYPGRGNKTQVSIDGGLGPAWNPKGGELFYQTASSLMSVPLADGVPSGPAKRLFSRARGERLGREYAVGPDGNRFLLTGDTVPSDIEINLVLNWFDEVKGRVARASR